YSPLVQPISIDEAFVDLSGTERLFGPPDVLAQKIRQRIRDELQLTGSIGLAANKYLAKLASDLDKPDGLTIIPPERAVEILAQLPIGRIWGIGPKTVAKLAGMNLRTIGDLQRLPAQWFIDRFGNEGEHYRRLAFGLDERPVTPDRD